MSKDFFDTLGSGISKVKNFVGECPAASDAAAKARLAALHQNAIEVISCNAAPLHEDFARVVKEYLVSNHKECGLKMPNSIGDVFCSNERDNITVNIPDTASYYNGFPSAFSLDFNFEVSRELFDGNIHDLNKPPRVSNEQIEILMNADLGKYAYPKGFTFNSVEVHRKPQQRWKVIITVKRVRWTDREIMQRMGGYII